MEKGLDSRNHDKRKGHEGTGYVDTSYIVEEFVDHATAHGLPRVLNVQLSVFTRVFWCVVTLFLFVIMLFQGTKLVISYVRHPTSTKISIVTKSSLDFPSVTLCNLNMLRRSRLNGQCYISFTLWTYNHILPARRVHRGGGGGLWGFNYILWGLWGLWGFNHYGGLYGGSTTMGVMGFTTPPPLDPDVFFIACQRGC